MWSAAVFEPAFPARSTMASGSLFPPSPWPENAVIGWKPNVFFQAGPDRGQLRDSGNRDNGPARPPAASSG